MSNTLDEALDEHYQNCDGVLDYYEREFYFEHENKFICKGCGMIIARID